MTLLNLVLKVFLMPGTLVLDRLGVSIEEDGGVMRSFINMCFWGTIGLWIALKYLT
ncbi:MAG: hypothetical protein JJ858_14660 [Rhizobiaceae bacterium]|jgi:FtsH-binding integral membrane protein|nr:hypothetical protein [Rhizobiaceae bacterium]